MKQLGTVAVIKGGMSAEREVSLMSGAAVAQALRSRGHDVIEVDIQTHAIAQLAELQFDVAFIALHGRGGEDGTIQGVLEWLDKPYTGSGVMGSAIAMDKWRTKLIWQAAGLPTPSSVLLSDTSDWQAIMAQLNFNAIVKPAREGSSIGMRRVSDATTLADSFHFASRYDSLVMAEQWVTGKEFTVALVGDNILPAIQLKTPHAFYDYNAKYEATDTEYLLPCGLSDDKEKELQQLSRQAFELLGCQGWGRVDVMQDEQGKFWLLEANTSPGMTDHSLVPMAAAAVGKSFAELVEDILTLALERQYG
ncbi:D-alanine--D-alanine ligase [Bacterioplanes sanyensis]|uniref:D-alanine--D-alanine ligase n=1 Tax=Bacterioplanes sanyensis TaxID=1249553 RepID=A0A222FDX6_9GAMM|nr:D-alanine--D-alanine ligase [Bacterioplanes sanyensis]ASP37218.1 D-alanine--D-alanine ligase [Bacterioplanes sanyensis]